MKRVFLAAGLIAALVPGAMAQDTKPAAATAPKDELSAKEKALVGVYKTDAAPITIELKASGKQLILAATGYPELNVTLSDKDELVATGLPEGFKFMVVRDKDGNATGLKIETPMGATEFKREAAAKPVVVTDKAKKSAIPDLLGTYVSDAEIQGMTMTSEMVYEKGKIIIRTEGQPDYVVTLEKEDAVKTEPALPDGMTLKMKRDKDGKYIGSVLQTGQGPLTFTRKTFPKPPTEDVAAPAFPDVLGKYEAEDAASPIATAEIVVREGKMILKADGQPDFPITIDKDDNILSDVFPAGVTVKLIKDKDGKYTKVKAETPMGAMVFNRKTFVKIVDIAIAETPKVDAKLAAVVGSYKAELDGLPLLTFVIRDGKLIGQAEGNPDIELTVSDKGELLGKLPEGFTLTLVKDKDGAITGIKANTPMGEMVFNRQKK